jgi:hypothetical protein
MDSVFNKITNLIEWFKSFERTEIMFMTLVAVVLGLCLTYFWNSKSFKLTKIHKDEDRKIDEEEKEELNKKSFFAEIEVHINNIISLEDFCNINSTIIITQFNDPNQKLDDDISLHLQHMNALLLFSSKQGEKFCSDIKTVKGHLNSYKMKVLDFLMYKKGLTNQSDSGTYKGAEKMGTANAELELISSILYDLKKRLEDIKNSS